MTHSTKIAPKETTSPISCIYYGTKQQLTDTLGLISVQHPNLRFAFMEHKADTDDTKDHIHLLIKTLANKIKNTDALRAYFKHEQDNKYYTTAFVITKASALADWALYVEHNEKYLEAKGQSRNLHYDPENLAGSPDFVAELHELARGYFDRQEQMNNDSDFTVITRLVEQGCDNFEIMRQLHDVRCDNLNAIWLGIEKVRANCSNIQGIKSQGVVDYFNSCGLAEALAYNPLALSPTTKLKCKNLTAEICARFIEVCIQKALNMDELCYILNGEITE